jgi:hypothetical protein
MNIELDRIASAMEKMAEEMHDSEVLIIGTPSTGGEIRIRLDAEKSLEWNVDRVHKMFLIRKEAIEAFKQQSAEYGFEKKPKESAKVGDL